MTSKFLSKAVAAAAFGGASLLIASPGIALAGDGEHDGHRKAGWVYSWPGHTTPGGTVTIVEICKKPQEKPWVWSEATGKLWLEPATDLDRDKKPDGDHKKDKKDHKGKKGHKDKDHKDKKDKDKKDKGHKDHDGKKGHKDHKDKKDHDKKDKGHKDKKDHKDKKGYKDHDRKKGHDKKGKEFFDGNEATWWDYQEQEHERFFFEENAIEGRFEAEPEVEVDEAELDAEVDAEAGLEFSTEDGTTLSYHLMSVYRDEPKRDEDKKHFKLFEDEAGDAVAEEGAAAEDEAEEASAETFGKDEKKKHKKGKKDKKHKKHPWAYFAETEISKKVKPGEYKLYGSCGKGKLIVAPKGSVDGGFGTGSAADPAMMASGAGMVAAAVLGGTVLLRRRVTDGSVA